MGTIITKVIFLVLKFFSRKEGEAEYRKHEYDSVDNFSVHAPKWIIPLTVIFELFFGSFAVLSYLWDLKIAVPCFIIICFLGLLALVHEQLFKIVIDGQQITVTRLFRGTKFFQRSQITSAISDNAGNIIVSFGSEKVKIESTMVNKDRFLYFAQDYAYENAGSINKSLKTQSYTVRRQKGGFIIYSLCTVFFCIMLALLPFYMEDFDSLGEKITAFAFTIILLMLSLFSLIDNIGSSITVDEENQCFSYRRGFVRKSAAFMQIELLTTKKMFLETKAFYYILAVRLSDSKTDTVKFISTDENSDRFANLLIKKFEEEQSAYDSV